MIFFKYLKYLNRKPKKNRKKLYRTKFLGDDSLVSLGELKFYCHLMDCVALMKIKMSILSPRRFFVFPLLSHDLFFLFPNDYEVLKRIRECLTIT